MVLWWPSSSACLFVHLVRCRNKSHDHELKKARDIVVVPMQQQEGSTDCNVFTIAVLM